MKNMPDKLLDYDSIIPDFREFASSLSDSLRVFIRVNTIKTTAADVERLLAQKGVGLEKTPVPLFYSMKYDDKPLSMAEYHQGYLFHQGITSAMAVIALDTGPGQTALDLCAAPGGKTTYLAQVMNDTGMIVANDRRHRRLAALMANVKRLGITNTVVTSGRGEHFSCSMGFDRVLVDAPCSGEGKWRVSPERGVEHMRDGNTDLPAIQKGLLKRGFDMLAPGGILVYSTCTYNPEENEGVVSYLLRKRRARVVEWNPPLESSPGVLNFMEKIYDDECGKCRRFYPHKTGAGGFFVARIAHA
jgi:NOL1/NOP2/sun family putative RNA methylase